MKIFFILIVSTYALFSQNNSSATKRVNKLLKAQKNPTLFYIQVGAFRNKSYAHTVYKILRKKAFPVKIEKKKIDMKDYFKLHIGPYKTKQKAYSIKNSLPLKYQDAFILTYNN